MSHVTRLLLILTVPCIFSLGSIAVAEEKPDGEHTDSEVEPDHIADEKEGEPNEEAEMAEAQADAEAELVAPDAKADYDKMKAAYTGLRSLALSGTVSCPDDEGKPRKLKFHSVFVAPNKFRYEQDGGALVGSS